MYDDKTGKRSEYPPRSGKPVKRPFGCRTPCYSCAKCRGSEEKSPAAGRRAGLDSRNWRTLALYHERPPEIDSIMRKNFGIIRWILDDFDRDQRRALVAFSRASLGVK